MNRLSRILSLLLLMAGALLISPGVADASAPQGATAGEHAAPVHAGADPVDANLTPAEATAEALLFLVVDAGVVMLVLSFFLCLMRVVRGPTLIDRGIATDTITLHVVGLAILLTIGMRTLLYFDAVLIFSILGFATTVAFAQFIGRRRAV